MSSSPLEAPPQGAETAPLHAELAAARAELQDFLYAVSHDLRAPLRHIRAYAEVIREDFPDLPAELLGHLDVMTRAAAQLQAQIDGLTALSRVAGRSLKPQAVDWVQSLRQALVATPWAAHGSVQGLSDLPPDANATQVWADPDVLAEVWAELIDNARKATAATPTPTLVVQSQWVDGLCRVSLHDNGMGWSGDQAQALFKPFGKLHPPQQFPGLGLGLVRARKLLARLGGTLALRAQAGQGCVATVGLPACPAGV
ncbi:MAG: hypothetical protein OHK0048_19060 [Rhodoferax sp.]